MTRGNDPGRSPIWRRLCDEWGMGGLAIVATGMAAYASIILSYRDYVPLWDGRIYADCVLAAAERLSFAALGCAGHNSQAYTLPLALAVRWFPGPSGSGVPIVVMNIVLGLVALAALARLLGRLLPGREHALDRALACAAFAVHPLFTASTLQPNVDFGTLVFALPCLCALLERRVMTAAVLGGLLVFTKEPALIVYGVFVLSALFFLVVQPAGTWREGFRQCGPFMPLAAPLLLAGMYLAPSMMDIIPDLLTSAAGGGRMGNGVAEARMLIDATDLNYFLGLFVLNFMWIPAIVISADVALRAYARWQGRADAPTAGPVAETGAIMYGTFVVAVILTRYKTFSNFRYFLTIYPLLIVICAALLARRVAWRPARAAVMGVLVVLFLASNFRTIDPVSRAAFGTWRFGTHDLIDVTVNTGECCGHGRDQLVYNLEFTAIAALEDLALEAIRPAPDTVLVMDEKANWYTLGLIDPLTFRRTLPRAGAFDPSLIVTPFLDLQRPLPDRLVYLAFEYVDNERSLTLLAATHGVTEVLDFDHRGYRLRAYRMARRPG